ncbi:diguanylate cyclase [Echinimonas agarilytica]|uniref:Diguanylate cyclase n=1 Tax=Echinimonas agarilytica TaxID=1215918 RepID=A0AA41W9V0_9GAMM|nr:diguanylate cyclase [Echinimonas agarilytica]MCM2680736.1 diguanylate cyclase [Echinimonas agarilytica]
MKYPNLSICISLFVLSLVPHLTAQATQLSYIPFEATKDKYPFELVQFLLSKIDHDYSFQPIEVKSMVGSRKISEVQQGNLSFAALSTSNEIEAKLRPIRIPIYKGLLGHRIFLIRSGEQHRFEGIKKLADLKRFTAGQGRFWGSTPVFRYAGIPIITPTKYKSLFYMLDGGRFGYFPRGIIEIYSELTQYSELSLAIEPNLMLVYPTAMYLFTSRENEALAKHLENAFNLAVNDGSFDQWFYNHPMIKEALSKIDIGSRNILHIDNPQLPLSAPLDRKELWFNIETH